jgi:translation initiation factor IF-3
MTVRDALRLAQEGGLDLVKIAPNAEPPVCRIMDYGRFKYEQSKMDKEAKKKQTIISIKEMKMRPNIEDHDYMTKTKAVRKFLEEGDKVKMTIMFRGREVTHPENGQVLLTRVAEDMQDIANVDKPSKLEGRNMTMILMPKQANRKN